MSYPTQPAFIHMGTWDDETRKHPAMKWMEDYTKNVIDKRVFAQGGPPPEELLPETILQTSDGRRIEGANNAWAALNQIYGPFKSHKHSPVYLIAYESADGVEMFGQADLYFNIGGPGNAVKDPEGQGWDGVGPAAFFFKYYVLADGGGFRLAMTKIFSDPSPALKVLLQAGALDGEQLAGMLKGS